MGIASRARPGPISSKTKGLRARDRRLVAARLTPLFLPKNLLAFLPQPCEIHVFPRSKINATPLTVSYYLTKPYFTYCYINAKNMELINCQAIVSKGPKITSTAEEASLGVGG